MAYWIQLFSPHTYDVFTRSDRSITGCRKRLFGRAQAVKPGDLLLCYLTQISRWVGLLEVLEGPYVDTTPIFDPADDPYVVRFRVRNVVWLPPEQAIPMYEDSLWSNLSFTRGTPKGFGPWVSKVRAGLTPLEDGDGAVLAGLLREQMAAGKVYPLEQHERRKLASVHAPERQAVPTAPPETFQTEARAAEPDDVRDSVRIQALLSKIGAEMGMQIWIPRADRPRVLPLWEGDHSKLLDKLPFNYGNRIQGIIENIDVLWIRGYAIQRAFEIEHTTSVYSGILRMADLLALQLNIDIRLHVVAPGSRRSKVLDELRRPAFQSLGIRNKCTYLSYESIQELSDHPGLPHLKESVLEDYEEAADDSS
ncbi:MAG TPA: hypothetical protein VNJ11_06135 [Bryobacteraceae bacterium]|nr:hypothetical protein [Bryobacteraceae bacterium]